MEDRELIRKIIYGDATKEDKQYYLDNLMSEFEKQINKPFWQFNEKDEIDSEVFDYNKTKGDLKYFDCDKCKNKGLVAINENNSFEIKDCDCLSLRRTMKLMERSGLGNILEICSFDNFDQESEWQKFIFSKAKEFISSNNIWFYIGGQSGSGKTHICTAITKEFINQHKPSRYMLWVDESTRLKQYKANSPEKYAELINELKEIEVLYIDDFLKVGKNQEPTTADINIAIEILNYRYNQARAEKNKRLITIISSERSIDEILDIDEATGSRILELTKPDYYIFVSEGKEKNYRRKGE